MKKANYARNVGKYAAIIIAALMLGMIVLSSGVSVMAAAEDVPRLENVQLRRGQDWGQWTFTYNMQSFKATEGDAITELSFNLMDYGATSAQDAASRSRASMEVKQGGITVYSWAPALTWEYWEGYTEFFWYTLPTVSVNIPIPSAGTTTIITTMETYQNGAWVVDTVWTNYVGEAKPIVYGDYLTDVSLSFNLRNINVENGDTVKVRENGTLSGVSAIGMIGNGSKPVVYYDQTTSYLDVSLVDYKGNVVYSDIVTEISKQQMPSSYYWRVEYGAMDIVQELLRFNEAYTIQIEMYTINDDWMTFSVQDRWVIYLDNEYQYIPPEDKQFAVISGALGFIGVLGFVGSPMLIAALMRRGMDATRGISILLMLMVVSGVFAYVFLLGGE